MQNHVTAIPQLLFESIITVKKPEMIQKMSPVWLTGQSHGLHTRYER
jgi:hypothetical protein